jgi:hypothetical protein
VILSLISCSDVFAGIRLCFRKYLLLAFRRIAEEQYWQTTMTSPRFGLRGAPHFGQLILSIMIVGISGQTIYLQNY